MHALTIGVVVNALSGVLMIGLGIFVASVKGGGRWNKYFALFAVAFGSAWIIDNLTREVDHYVTGGRYGFGACLVVAAIGLLLMVLAYPEPWRTASRRIRTMAVTAGIGVGASFALVQMTGQPAVTGALENGSLIAFRIGHSVFSAVVWGALFLFALRFGAVRDDTARVRSQYAIMSTSLIPFPAFVLGYASLLYGPTNTASYLALALTVTVILSYAAAWGWSLRGKSSSTVRWIPLLAAGVALIGMLSAGWVNNPGFGIARTLTVVILAYAILRHQLLGIDVKVRWGISKTTLAGIFVAVFFVTSEVAQQFFGERLGGPYVGIIAAGLLVFAIAPLSRFADGLAAKAVPLATTHVAPTSASQEPEDLYRIALRVALRDRRITRNEEIDLHRLAAGLGIEPARAHELLAETELEAADAKRRKA